MRWLSSTTSIYLSIKMYFMNQSKIQSKFYLPSFTTPHLQSNLAKYANFTLFSFLVFIKFNNWIKL